MRGIFAVLLACTLIQAVMLMPVWRSAAESSSDKLAPHELHKRMDPNPQGWFYFNRFVMPDSSLTADTSPSALREKYGHMIHHKGMPVFAAEDARDPSERQLMKQAMADFGYVQVYGIPTQSSTHLFQVQKMMPSHGTMLYREVDNQEHLLNNLDIYHGLERRFGPNLKQVLMGPPMDAQGRFGGHSTNRVWQASQERLSHYSAATLRDKLNRDRFGLFLSQDGQRLLAITVGNNGVARVVERANDAAPYFAEVSRRF